MNESKEMILLDEALAVVEQQVSVKGGDCRAVSVRQALGCIVVEDQVSCLDLPPFDKSAMDGYAVLKGDNSNEYRVLETTPAGRVPTKKLIPGTCTKVMTGAVVPRGAGKVIMIEQARQNADKITVLKHSEVTNICRKGEDLRRGDMILQAPALVGPLEIANLISAGITEIKVAAPVCVSIISTGDEIVEHPDQLTAGKIMNSNAPMLDALCQQHGLEVLSITSIGDKLEDTVEALCDALEVSDIVLLSGGVSVGDFDFVTEAITKVGLKLHFNRLAVKPGKPMTFATAEQKCVFGLPGNPVAVYLMFHLFALYAARLMVGLKQKTGSVRLPLACDFSRRKADRQAYLPCKITGDAMARPIEYHGTAHLAALIDCDGFFIVPQGTTKLSAGQKIDFISIKGTLL